MAACRPVFFCAIRPEGRRAGAGGHPAGSGHRGGAVMEESHFVG